jgi:hypothetical protein
VSRDSKDFIAVWAVIGVFVLAAVIGVATLRPSHQRSPISNHSTYAQVKANFDGKPAGNGAYVAGFKHCGAWTNGKKGHGWIVIGCVK